MTDFVRFRVLLVAAMAVSPMGLSGQFRASEPVLEPGPVGGQTAAIVFTLMANEVRATSAAWVFAKFQDENGNWRDVRWAESGHSVQRQTGTSGALDALPATGGPFVPGLILEGPRGMDPVGDGEWTVELIWDYSTSQIELPEAGYPVSLQVIDMVRIPEGPFALGEAAGSDDTSAFVGPGAMPLQVTSEDAIEVGSEGLLYEASDYGGDRAGPVPAAFPKGFTGFYVMRQELTDGQYAAFLGSLSGRGRAARDVTRTPGYADAGGSIVSREGDVFATEPDRPANFITWADGIAWAAWAGLRPMSELEFEKIARTPQQGGAEGILGGRWERTVSVGTPEGRRFLGSHGLGFLDDLAQPFAFLNGDWPGPMAVGSGFRGGADGLDAFTTPGHRVYAAYDATYGGENEGFRAVRTAWQRPSGGLDP